MEFGSLTEFSSTFEGDLRLGVGHSDSSDILEVIPILACLLLATNLAFFCNIYSGLSTECTNLALMGIKGNLISRQE